MRNYFYLHVLETLSLNQEVNMKNGKWILLMIVVVLLSACASTPIDHSKPEMSVKDRNAQPPRTFNQFHNEWDY